MKYKRFCIEDYGQLVVYCYDTAKNENYYQECIEYPKNSVIEKHYLYNSKGLFLKMLMFNNNDIIYSCIKNNYRHYENGDVKNEI